MMNFKCIASLAAALATMTLYSCSAEDVSNVSVLPEVPVNQRTEVTDLRTLNAEAPIPPQCYTKTDSKFNPCYTCHQTYPKGEGLETRMNVMNDGGLQGSYDFSDIGVNNHWSNLFVDRNDWLKAVSDDSILEYINQDNYSSLADRLKEQNWQGFIPDLEDYSKAATAFDEKGLARDGSHWVAFNYKPFLGTFWPTNGSTDDVVIRLPEAFRSLNGQFDVDAYYINLTIAELSLKNLDSAILWEVDENRFGVDLDNNGSLNKTNKISKRTTYVGDAKNINVVDKQFPTGTEFMHSVRYVGVEQNDKIVIPPRMKELRYMKKVNTLTAGQLDNKYWNERKEKFLGELPGFLRKGDEGFDNSLGWYVKGFIEDYNGDLRPQTYEEDFFCMGCHANIGTTIDSTFSFARKVTGGEGWGYINLHGMKDAPSVGEPESNEILAYLKRAGGGSEFRENPEMIQKWFNQDGTVNEEKVKAADVYTLLAPSRERALNLNKAYSHIVRHQSFIHGRDATWSPVENVIHEVTAKDEPLSEENRFLGWDMRLNWN